jgi:diadenosine tetraphosphate (Ap4A) HIT family hydrolase
VTEAEPCPFCEKVESREGLVLANDWAIAFPDAFPLTDGHTLVVPRRHVARSEGLEPDEWNGLFELVREVASEAASAPGVEGVNVGFNSGEVAGQTVFHAHVHVIPRRPGDVEDPRGGVRGLIPDKADYWTGEEGDV